MISRNVLIVALLALLWVAVSYVPVLRQGALSIIIDAAIGFGILVFSAFELVRMNGTQPSPDRMENKPGS